MSARLTNQAIQLLVERRWPMLPSTGVERPLSGQELQNFPP